MVQGPGREFSSAPETSAPQEQEANSGPDELSEEEVYDALLTASLADDMVGKSAQLALHRLGQSGNHKLVQRAVDMLSKHAKELAEDTVSNGIARRAALFRLLSSIVGNYAEEPVASASENGHGGPAASNDVSVTEYLIEQVINDLEWEQSAGDDNEATEALRLREAAEMLLVQLAAHHMTAVLERLLSRLDNANMFQQHKAQAAARFRSRAGTQWFADKSMPHDDQRLIGILSGVEALAREKPEQLSKHLRKVLAAMLPVIGLATSAASKEAWSRTMCAYCNAAQAHSEEQRAAAENSSHLRAPGEHPCANTSAQHAVDGSARMAMLAAYDVLAVSWSASSDAVVQRSSFLSLAAMTALLPSEDLRERLPTVVAKLCQMLAAANSTMQVRVCVLDPVLQTQVKTYVTSLCTVLETALAKAELPDSAKEDCSQEVLTLAPTVMNAVLPLACRPPHMFDAGQVSAFKHSLECFRLLARVDASKVVAFLHAALCLDAHPRPAPRARSVSNHQQRQWGALAVLTHVVSRVPAALNDCQTQVVGGALVQCANSSDALVRIQLANFLMAVAPLGLLHNTEEIRHDSVCFLVASISCAFAELSLASSSPPAVTGGGGVASLASRLFGGARGEGGRAAAPVHETGAAGVSGSEVFAPGQPAPWWWPREMGEEGTRDGAIKEMRSVCGNALYNLATKLPQPRSLLWPALLHYVGAHKYATALPELCRAIVSLSRSHVGPSGPSVLSVDYAHHPATPSPPHLFSGLLVPLCIHAPALTGHAAGRALQGSRAPAHVSSANAHVHMINALCTLAGLFPPSVADNLARHFPVLLDRDAASAETEGGAASDIVAAATALPLASVSWAERVAGVLKQCLLGAEEAFVTALSDALMEQRHAFDDEDEAASETINHLLGAVLACARDERLVRIGLHNMFVETDHSSVRESHACAQAFRSCVGGGAHVAAALEVLEQVLKDEHARDASLQQRAAGWLGLASWARTKGADDSHDMAVASALLALGHVLHCSAREGPAALMARHLPAMLTLAHVHLARSPGERAGLWGPSGLGMGSGVRMLDRARVRFLVLAGEAVQCHAGVLQQTLVQDHVDKVLVAVPQLVAHGAENSLQPLQTLSHVIGMVGDKIGGDGTPHPAPGARTDEDEVDETESGALRNSLSLVRVCQQVCELEAAFSHRAFEQLIAALTPILEHLTAARDDGGGAALLHAALLRCLAAAVSTLQKRLPANQTFALAVSVMVMVQPLARAPHEESRARACSMVLHVLKTIVGADEGTGRYGGVGKPLSREEWGSEQLAKLSVFYIPRLADPAKAVRGVACEALALLSMLVSQDSEDALRVFAEAQPPSSASSQIRSYVDGEEDAHSPRRVVEQVMPCLRRLIAPHAAVGAAEQLLLAIGDDSQLASAQAAAAALSCLFNPSFSRATSQDDAGGEEIDVGREEINLSAETTGVLARAVISIGANCAHNSLQQRAASSCLCDLARLQLPVVLYVVLAADWLDAPGGGSSKSAAERRFAVSALVGGAGELGPPLLQLSCQLLLDPALHANSGCGRRMLRLADVASYTSFKDMALSSSGIQSDRHRHKDRERDVDKHVKEVSTLNREGERSRDETEVEGSRDDARTGVGMGSAAAIARNVRQRQVLRLLSDLLKDSALRPSVEDCKNALSAALFLSLGSLALQHSGILEEVRVGGTYGQAEMLLRRNANDGDNEAWSEIRACLVTFLHQAGWSDVADAIRAQDVWARLANGNETVEALLELALLLFSSDLSSALTDSVRIILPVSRLHQMLGPDEEEGEARASCPDALRSDKAAGSTEVDTVSVSMRCAALLALAGLVEASSHQMDVHTDQDKEKEHTNRQTLAHRDKDTYFEEREEALGDVLLVLAEVFLPNIRQPLCVSPTSPDGNNSQHLPVRIVAKVVASVPALCKNKRVRHERGAQLVAALLRCVQVHNASSSALVQHAPVAAEAASTLSSSTMSLELSALLAQEQACREQDRQVLLYAAATALPVCLLSLPLPTAHHAALSAYPLVCSWWNASNFKLRAAAADVAAAMARLSHTSSCATDALAAGEDCYDQQGDGSQRGRGGGVDAGGAGVEEPTGGWGLMDKEERTGGEAGEEETGVERLREVGREMMRELLLGLGDEHRAVRVACKRAAAIVGLFLFRQIPEMAALLKSSALDERWQTDLPGFMFNWLRLLSLHLPSELPGYVQLITSGVLTRRHEAVCVVAHMGGALLRLRRAVASVSRQLVTMLAHPDTSVRCAAAQALQHFLPPPESSSASALNARTGCSEGEVATAEPKWRKGEACLGQADAKLDEQDKEEDAIMVRLMAQEALEAGNQALDADACPEAVAHYSRGLECDKSVVSHDVRARLFSQRAVAYARVGSWHDSLIDACSCLQLRPLWASALESKGSALYALGREAEALEAWRAALAVDPSSLSSIEPALKATVRAAAVQHGEEGGEGGQSGEGGESGRLRVADLEEDAVGKEAGGLTDVVSFILGADVMPSSSIRRLPPGYIPDRKGKRTAAGEGDTFVVEAGAPVIQATAQESTQDSDQDMRPVEEAPEANTRTSAAQDANAVNKTHTRKVMERWLLEEETSGGCGELTRDRENGWVGGNDEDVGVEGEHSGVIHVSGTRDVAVRDDVAVLEHEETERLDSANAGMLQTQSDEVTHILPRNFDAPGADTDQRQDMANPSFAVATATSTVPAAFASEDHHTAQGKGKKKKKKNRSVVSQENGQGPLEGSSGGVRSKFGSGEEARECGGTGESGTVCPGTQPSPTVGKTLSLVEQLAALEAEESHLGVLQQQLKEASKCLSRKT